MAMKWDDTLFSRVKQAAALGVVRGALRVKNAAVRKIMTGPKTGRVTRRRGVTHQASAPGEAPATDTGRLAKSGRTEDDIQNVRSTVIFSTEYAESLELGTDRMEPRPFLRNTLAEEAPKIRNDISREIEKVLKAK